MERRLYTERMNLLVKDFQDQPEEEFVALIETLGDRSAVAFTKVVFNGESVVLVSAPGKLADTQGKMIAAFPVKSNWVILRRDQFLMMNGREWDKHKLDDGKNRKELLEELYGKDKVVQIATFPDGRQAVLPATDEQAKEFLESQKREGEEKFRQAGFGQYL